MTKTKKFIVFLLRKLTKSKTTLGFTRKTSVFSLKDLKQKQLKTLKTLKNPEKASIHQGLKAMAEKSEVDQQLQDALKQFLGN